MSNPSLQKNAIRKIDTETLRRDLYIPPEITTPRLGKLSFIENTYPSIILTELKKRGLVKGLQRGYQKAGVKFFHKHGGQFSRSIIEDPGGYEPLHLIYLNDPKNWIEKFFLSRPPAEGTRERLNIYQEILARNIEELYHNPFIGNLGSDEETYDGKINILDLGTGAGLAPVGAVHSSIANNGIKKDKINLVLVDKNDKALEASREEAEKYNLSEITQFKNYNIMEVADREDIKYHIVGTHGVIDYFKKNGAVSFYGDIADVLEPEGMLLTTNMIKNEFFSRYLIETFGKWNNINYRSPEEFKYLVESSGRYNDIQLYVLPMGFHAIITARRK
jgi:2-polyprenyl-3-methyl-5-hydroxy-6-metoxy-1,4-benzoquinol methylase